MRRVSRILIFILCVCLLTGVVYADSTATSVDSICYVSSDGSCQVSLAVSLHLDTAAKDVTFPLPKNAKNVTVNGSSIRTYSSSTDANVILADLSYLDGMMGDISITFNYSLSSVLKTEDKKLYLEVPLLCGFDYPVQSMNFTVNLPAQISSKPTFSSGYLQSGIESVVQYTQSSQQITGSTTQALQDRETLTMTMAVSEEVFPGKLVVEREGNPEVVPMGICAGLAFLYWLLFMRCLPLIRQRRTTPLEGVSAGELGSHLTAAGADLTMMVFTWARLGYLRICPDKHGRVILQKRMDMGNERSAFETRYFQALFSRGQTIDATGSAYAKLCRKAAGTIPGVKEMYTRRAGNIKLFRMIASGISLFSGICFAMNLMHSTVLQVLFSIVLAVLGVITAWGIQGSMYKLHVRGKVPLLVGLVCTALWILVGIISGQVMIAVITVLAQMLAGLGAAYGGRRSDLGRYQAGQILGLRSYLKKVPREELYRIMQANPDYFFEMLPYAIALGVDTPFARSFGKMKIGHCPYLAAREDRRRTAEEWALLCRKTADKMDKRQRQMELEKWTVVSIRRK